MHESTWFATIFMELIKRIVHYSVRDRGAEACAVVMACPCFWCIKVGHEKVHKFIWFATIFLELWE